MGSRRSSSSILLHLPTILLISLRLRSSIAFFFSSGGCSCPACPPPQPAVCSSQCGGSCSDGIGGGGYSGECAGGGTGGGCAVGGTGGGYAGGGTGGGCAGCNIQIAGCGNGNGGGIGTGDFGAASGGGGGPRISQASSSSSCPPQQNCVPANCVPSNFGGCSAQSVPNYGPQTNSGNCVTSAAECDGGSVEGDGSVQQQMANNGNGGGGAGAPSLPASSNCQSIQICAPSHPSSPGSSSCQPICASSPSTVAQSPTGAGGTYVHGPAQPVPTPNHPVMPSYPSEPPPVASPFEGNNINNFAAGSNSHHQQNAGAAESAFTTQQQPQLGPQPAAPLPVQPPPPSEPDNQSDRENTAEGIGGGYRDTGLNNGGKEGGLSLLSSKLIRVGGGLSTTTMRLTSVDWDLYEEKLPDLADYETETSIASGGASIGTKDPPVKASNPTTPTTSSTSTSTKSTFYTVRTSSRRLTPTLWGAPQSTSTTTTTTSTTTAAPSSRPTTTTIIIKRTMMSSSVGENKENNDLLSDDYSENSFKKVHASVKNRNGDKLAPFTSSSPSSSTTVAAEDPKCSSETLRAIMQENIVLSPTISKQLIFSAGRLAFGQSIDVICSKNKFSYTVVSSKVFCEATNGPVTCFSFLQP